MTNTWISPSRHDWSQLRIFTILSYIILRIYMHYTLCRRMIFQYSTVLGKQLGLLPEQAALVGRFARETRLVMGFVFPAKQCFIKSTWPAKDFGLTVERSCWAPCLISPSWSWSELLLLSLFWQLENPTLVVIQGFCTQYFWRVGRPTPMNVWPLTHVATGKWTSSISTLPVRRGQGQPDSWADPAVLRRIKTTCSQRLE